MNFNDVVKENLKTKSEIAKETIANNIEIHNKTIIAAAEYNYERLKNEIIEKAKTGQSNNGIISGVFRFERGLYSGGYDERNVPYYESFFDFEDKFKGNNHDLFLVAWETHYHSLKIKNVDNVIAVFNLMKQYGEKDGIELIDIFLYAVVQRKKDNTVVSHRRFPVRSKGYVKYKTAWGYKAKKRGDIYLAIEYRYIIK